MVVDGEVLIRTELSNYLRHCGYIVIEAASTDEAKTVLAKAQMSVDVVLCDADAPGEVNGFGFASWLRKEHPQIDIILAGTVDKAAQEAAKLCDDGPHLARPYDPTSVSDFIRQRLAQRDRNRKP